EKFNRATSIPARMSRASISGDSDAGPMVATILVLCAESAAFIARTLCSLLPEIAHGPLQALGHCRLREREMRARVIHFLLSPFSCLRDMWSQGLAFAPLARPSHY